MQKIAKLCAVFAAFALLGCARTSPLVGTWTVPNAGMQATLQLKEDGTGVLQMPVLPSQPVSWTEKENQVTLQIGGGAKTDAGTTNTGVGTTLTATLSEDQKALTVPFPTFTLTLEKQDPAQR